MRTNSKRTEIQPNRYENYKVIIEKLEMVFYKHHIKYTGKVRIHSILVAAYVNDIRYSHLPRRLSFHLTNPSFVALYGLKSET